ncbi:MAG: hypothetical protein KatS3mg097_343 [Candidatus Parcubacteria bacterium]|nr:MAG: hypothetical protein KatS3mg097_343 [Candidatus Parcubacteria bacterium]
MPFEQLNFDMRKSQPKSGESLDDILQELRKLQEKYFKSASKENKKRIEQRQFELVEQLKKQAEKILAKTEDETISQEERDKLMGQYGFTMDQLAINLPWSEISLGKERDIQNQALETLQLYFKLHPQAKEVARSIFMLFHHGAGINKELTADAYQRLLQKQPPSQEFAYQYMEAENKGKSFLEKYIALVLNKERFSLDNDYQELIKIEQISNEQFSLILDVANWFRRVAYYQKIAGITEGREINIQRAIELYKKLAKQNASFNKFIDEIYKEQGINESK